MKTNVSKNDFVDSEPLDCFSYEARIALWEYFEEYEYGTGYELDFDPVAIRGEFVEYSSIEDFWEDYSRDEYTTLQALMDYTTVIEVNDSCFLIEAF
jgi:hypothetical protein